MIPNEIFSAIEKSLEVRNDLEWNILRYEKKHVWCEKQTIHC